MDNGFHMLENRDFLEIMNDYGEVSFFLMTGNSFSLNGKLRDIEHRYCIELAVYNAFCPRRYIFSLDEQAWKCMDFLRCVAASKTLAEMFRDYEKTPEIRQ